MKNIDNLIKKATLIAALGLCSSVALAAGINAENGIYLGGGVASLDVGSDSIQFPKVYLGYRFNDYTAVELTYVHIAAFDPVFNYIDLAGKVIYPFQNGISVYAKASVGSLNFYSDQLKKMEPMGTLGGCQL